MKPTEITDECVYWDMDWNTYKVPGKEGIEVQFEECKALARLLAHEVVYINSSWWEKEWPEAARNATALFVGCNDIFAWGCSDGETMLYDDLQDLYDHWLKDPSYGSAVWCCKRRKELPQRPVLDAIKKAGIWDMESMGLEPNGYDTARASMTTQQEK